MSGAVPPRPVTPAGILAARLEALVTLAADAGVPGEVATAITEASALAAGLEGYVAACTTPESPALAALAAATAAHDWQAHNAGGGTAVEQEMLSGHVEGQLLATLVHATGARSVLEVGMFTGYSALAMAEALPPGGRVVACEIDPGVAAFAKAQFAASPDSARITVEVGPALDTLRRLATEGARFDLVFVDADKAGYRSYLDAVLDGGLLAPGGLVCVDNTLMQGQPWTGAATSNGRAIAEFNRAVADDSRVAQVLLPLRDGVTLIRRVDGR